MTAGRPGCVREHLALITAEGGEPGRGGGEVREARPERGRGKGGKAGERAR